MDQITELVDSVLAERKTKTKKKFNIRKFSAESGMPFSTTWFYFRAKRKWPALALIKAMQFLDVCSIDRKTCSITMKFPTTNENKKIMKSLEKQE
jgi:hypothetical protein